MENILLALNKKPVDTIRRVGFLLSPPGSEETEVFNNKVIEINSNHSMIFLISGELTLLNKDGSSIVVSAPLIVGLSGYFGYGSKFRFRAHRNTVCQVIKTHSMNELAFNNDLWRDLANIMAFNSYMDALMSNMLRSQNKSISSRILDAIKMTHALQIKSNKKILLAKNIILVTGLSRSVVMKNLRSFKENGYIEVERGFLVSINSSMPEQ